MYVSLPDEALFNIMLHLDDKSLRRIGIISSNANKIYNDPYFWDYKKTIDNDYYCKLYGIIEEHVQYLSYDYDGDYIFIRPYNPENIDEYQKNCDESEQDLNDKLFKL